MKKLLIILLVLFTTVLTSCSDLMINGALPMNIEIIKDNVEIDELNAEFFVTVK